jgi:hypothetical protein
MKTKKFKSAFAESVLSIEPLKEFWTMFSDVYKYKDPKKAFLFANSGSFKNNIFEFSPQLAPFSDYDVELKDFSITKKYFKVSVAEISDAENKLSMNENSSIHIINGVKQKPKNPKEYCRLVIVHIMCKPVVDGKPPFMIFTLTSEPKVFRINRCSNFRIPSAKEIDADFNSYKYHRTFAFFINYLTETSENYKGESESFDNIFSCSDVYFLNTMLLEDSDIKINFPPHFNA